MWRTFQPELKYDNVHVYELDQRSAHNDVSNMGEGSEVKSNTIHAEPHGGGICLGRGRRNDLRRSTKRLIRPGDYIFIPKGTRPLR